MSAVHFREQAGAAGTSAIAGDVTGTLPATTVAKVVGLTPTAPGLALLTAPTFAEALALLGAERAPVNAATTTTLPSYTRVGNVLTGTANGALAAQDGVSLVLGQRLLVKNETGGNQPYNGIYTVTQLGVVAVSPFILTRSADCDTSAEITGAFTEVLAGTVNAGSQWVMTTATPTLGTTALSWQEYGGVSPFGPVGGDLSGTLPNPTVAKLAGATPSANGVSLVSAADYATMRTLLGVSASSSQWTEVTSTAQQSDTTGTAVVFTGIASQALDAASVYEFEAWILGGTAVNTTGLQWYVSGPTNNVIESETAVTPLTSSTQAIRQGQVNNVVAGTTFVSGALGMGRAFGIMQTHATAPDAGLQIKFNTEVAASAATIYVAVLRYRKLP